MSRRTVAIAFLSFAALTVWSLASARRLTAHDEATHDLSQRQSELTKHYEEKLAALRARLDQVSAQRLAEQQRLQASLSELLARQARFERRNAVVHAVTERAGPGVVAADMPAAAGVTVYSPATPWAAPEGDLFQLRLNDSESLPARLPRTSDLGPLEAKVAQAAQVMAALEADQIQTLESAARRASMEAAQLRAVLTKAGLGPAAFASGSEANIGGPLVAIGDALDQFDLLSRQAQAGMDRVERLRRRIAMVPLQEPIRGELDLTSGFGYRVDPFTRGLALHSGIDFKAEYGASVRAAGSGRVVVAENSGAYGNMVEIDHGEGITSRYAHLSSIAVGVGQAVKAGTMLGRVGSTGRSTGPHLHYETRVEGEAVDPQRFLMAGVLLGQTTLASAR